jgi:outer membrane receptor protein involved in Fe transport
MTRSRKRKLHRLSIQWASMPLAAGALACGGVAYAQQAQQTEAGGGLEEIIVTAQKRVEDVQKVPISIQVLGGEKLEQLQVSNFIDYAKFLPSVSFQTVGPGQSQLYFRGISAGYNNLHAGPLPSTGVYLDETPVSTLSGVLDVHMYDIERVEGLAGPQGTLYGASSLAGTLRIITNKPDPKKFAAGFDVKGTSFAKGGSGGSFEGFVNLPAGDRAAIRLVGYYDKEGGYIDNVPFSRTYQRPSGAHWIHDPTRTDLPQVWIVCHRISDKTEVNPVTGNTLYQDYVTACGGAANLINDNETANPHAKSFDNGAIVGKNQNSTENYGGRLSMKLDVSDDWSVLPTVMHQNQKAHGDFTFDPKIGDLKVGDMRAQYNNDKWTQYAMTITGKIANLDFVYSGSWFNRHVDNQYDYSLYTVAYDSCYKHCYNYLPDHWGPSPGVANVDPNNVDPNQALPDPTQYVSNVDEYTKASQEVRISTPTNYATRLLVGGFLQRQTDAFRAEFRIDGISSYWSVDRNNGILYLSDMDRVDRDAALFADVTHDFTDKFKMSAGIREFKVDNTLFGFFGYSDRIASMSGERVCPHDPVTNQVIPDRGGVTRPCVNIDSRVTESGETHRVNLTYQATPDRMLYATYSTGYRPGGNNRRPQAVPWKSDTITNYEVGWKTSWDGNRVRFNGAVFHEDWKGVQVPIQGENGITSMVNAGNARTEGIETELNWLAATNLNLTLSGTYVKANTTTDFCQPTSLGVPVLSCDASGLAAASGNQLPGIPKIKANATARYRFNVNGYESFVQLAGVYTGSTVWGLQAPRNAVIGDTPAYSSFDFSIGTARDNWTLEAYVGNVTDERGELARNTECADPYSVCDSNYRVVPILPRNFALKFGHRF